MAKKKKEVDPVELEEAPKQTKWSKTKGFVRGNEKTLWRSFLTAAIAVLTLIATNGDSWVKSYMENQKKQAERQAGWQVKAEARHKALLANDSILIAQNDSIFKLLKSKRK